MRLIYRKGIVIFRDHGSKGFRDFLQTDLATFRLSKRRYIHRGRNTLLPTKDVSSGVSVNSENGHHISSWMSTWFAGVKGCPYFTGNGEKIKILTEPNQFYFELKERIQSANERIVLASLYLGNGELEREMVNCLYNRLKESQVTNPEFQVHVLVDHTRGSRGKVNSRTLLLPLLQDFPSQTTVALYHTPNLRGMLKAIVPERFNETIGVTHLKVYLFDDCLIMSGANLSNDYFTDRQDRYMMIEDCRELCDYFQELVQTVSKFSLQLTKEDTTKMDDEFQAHPYHDTRRKFIKYAKKLMKTFTEKYERHDLFTKGIPSLWDTFPGSSTTEDLHPYSSPSTEQSPSISEELPCSSEESPPLSPSEESSPLSEESPVERRDMKLSLNSHESRIAKDNETDTIIIPLLQMYDLKLRQDELVTLNLFKSVPSDINLVLATAYFNLTKKYWNVILKSFGNYNIIMAHPRAMGFFNAPGMAGGVPFAYTHLAKHFYKDIVQGKKEEQIVFLEYLKPGWTFHGKGLWAELGKDKNSSFLTLIGSPNFGYRSVYRDLEAQLLIVTSNDGLKSQLRMERDQFFDSSSRVNEETYENKDRDIPFWVYLIATFMRSFF